MWMHAIPHLPQSREGFVVPQRSLLGGIHSHYVLFMLLSRRQVVLQHFPVWQCGMEPCLLCSSVILNYRVVWDLVSLCYRVKPVLLCLLVVCCDVHPGLGMNWMQDLGVEETSNGLDKPSAERKLTKRSEWMVNLHCMPWRTLEGKA